MKCRKCVKLGLKSTVHVNHNMMSCLVLHHHDDYYDEEGVHHFHENVCNQNPDTAVCSNNHRWQMIRVARCNNCKWKSSENDEVVFLEDRKELKEGQAYMNDEPVDIVEMNSDNMNLASGDHCVVFADNEELNTADKKK